MKNLDKSAQMSAFGIVQQAIMGNVILLDFFPGGRKWSGISFFRRRLVSH
jgi:hypothetical protein